MLVNRVNICIFISKSYQKAIKSVRYKFMNFDYQKTAKEVIQKNSPQAIRNFQKLLTNQQHIDRLLDTGKNNQTVLFVTTEMLSKIILRGQFLAPEQSKSKDGENQKGQQLQQIRIYSRIMSKVYQIVMRQVLANYLEHSCINLVSLCLKNIFDKAVVVELNFFAIQEYIGVLLPGFQITEKFIINLNNQIVIIQPRIQNIPQGFSKAMKAFNSILEYVTFSAYFKTYYDFRRNIYIFRNSSLPILLNIAVQYSKYLLNACISNKWNINQFIIHNLSSVLSFLDGVFMFPFTLSLRQSDNELEPNDKITGNNGQIYFPHYFRNVICDMGFIRNLGVYYQFLTATGKSQVLPELKKIVRIMGRMSSASGYSFNKEQQKEKFRNSAVEFGITLISSQYSFQDHYFLNSLSQIFQKILSSYKNVDYGNLKKEFLEAALKFAYFLVANSKIILQEGKKNPYSAGLEIICILLRQSLETPEEAVIKQLSEKIMQKGLTRMCNNDQVDEIMQQFGYQNPNQIECFQQLFTFISAPFQQFQQKNLAIISSINFENLGRASRTVWLHLGSLLLPSHESKIQHTKIILKFYDIARQTQGIASLHYTITLVNQIMLQMQENSKSTLWFSIQELIGENFNNFLMNILQKCFSIFTIPNEILLDYTLAVFNSIYTKLKKNDMPQFERFYNLVNDMLININKTVLVQPKFFKKRVSFFNLISVIWLNQKNFKYTYQIYYILLKQMKQTNDQLVNFLKFLCDMTGLLQPIQSHQSFQILAELLLEDLKKLLPYYLGPNTIETAFSEPQFLKAFLNLVLSLCENSKKRAARDIHARLPIEIHELFYPYLCQAIKFDVPQITVKVWQKFISLVPIGQMLPLSKSFSQLNSIQYPLLIKLYFQKINRCTQKQLEGLYDYIQGSIQFMVEWWEQIMARGLKPKINMKKVAEARIWQNRRQKQIFAKLIFCIGTYNPFYWSIPQDMNEMAFTVLFTDQYQG